MGIPASITEDISLEQLMAKRASVDGAADLSATNKKTVLNLLDKAIQLRELADKINRQRDEISQTLKDAPDRLKKIQSAIDQSIPTTSAAETEASAMSTLQLEQRLQQEEAELASAQNNFSNWYPMVHTLNRQINSEFKKAGITISFPQRDVHLDTSNPLEIRVVSDQAGPKTT